MLNRYFLILFLIGLFLKTSAQLQKDIFPLTREFKKGALFISPELTYSIGNEVEKELTINDSSYNYKNKGNGKFGYGISLGWFHSFKRKQLIQAIEGSIGYRVFKGETIHNGTLNTPIGNSEFSSDNTYKTDVINTSIRAKSIKQIGSYSFLTLGLGLNYYQELSRDLNRSNEYPAVEEEFANNNHLQLHFQIGLGLKLTEKLLLVPTLETPLLTMVPFNELSPSWPFFDSKYQPIILSFQFIFLRKDPLNCNAPRLK